MADIRINALATTAASTASDDFVAVDGSANGTRKLNAFSPTFGGNLTVSGNMGLGSAASSWGGGAKAIQGQNGSLAFYDGATDQLWLSQNAYWDGSWKYIANGFASSLQQYNGELYFYSAGSGSSGGSITLSEKLKLDASGNTTLAGNLTVSGTGGFGNTVSITKAGGAILELNDSNQTARIRTVQTGVTHDLAFHVESAEKMRLFSNGNLFIGASPVDGGQKLQVSGTAYVSGNTLFGGNLTVGSATTPKGKIDAQAAYDGSAPSTSSTPIIRANNGGAISLWMGGNAYSYMWMQAIQDDGSNNIKNINFQPLGGDVNFGGNATFAGDVFSTKSINIASGYSLTAQDSGNTYRTILRGIADNTVEIGWGTATPTNGHLIFKAGGTEQGRINPAGGWILGLTASAPVLGTNSTMTFELTSNTSLTIKVRGTDGTTRSATLTLS